MPLDGPGSRRLLLLTGLLAAVGCGEAPTSLGDVPGDASQGIVGGEAALEQRNVFVLLARSGPLISTCTATLIAPNVLLTARHCVSVTDDEPVICGDAALGRLYGAEDLRASNPVQLHDSTRWFKGATIHVPPEGNDTCGFDVALVRLTENVPSAMAEPAVPRIDRAVQAGEPYVAVGYGVDENGDERGRIVRGDLRVTCSPGTCGRRAVGTEFVGDTGVCRGDSGGPAFDSAGKLVGIVSRGGENCSVPIYGAVSAWREWIVRVTAEAAALGGYPTPFWVTSGLSDPPTDSGISVPPVAEVPGTRPEPEPDPAPIAEPAEPPPDATCSYSMGSSGSPMTHAPWFSAFAAALVVLRRKRSRSARP